MLVTPAGRVLRPAIADDAAAFAALEQDAQQKPFVPAFDEATHRRFIASPNFEYLVYAGTAGDIRGYMILAGLADTAARVIELYRMVVDKRRFGIGGDLLAAAVRHAFRDLNAHRLWTDTFEDNDVVRRSLAHYGFIEEGTLRDAMFFDGRYRSVVFMGLLESEVAPELLAAG